MIAYGRMFGGEERETGKRERKKVEEGERDIGTVRERANGGGEVFAAGASGGVS